MPKIKTSKTAAKRFKITGTGKITHRKSYNNHQFLHKKASRKRRLEQEPEVFQGEQKRVRRLLVIGQTAKKATAARGEKAPTDRARLVALVS